MVNNFMQPIKEGRGVYDYLVQSDASNNPPYLVDQGELVVTLFLKPVIPAENILLQAVITSSGASFNELLSATNV